MLKRVTCTLLALIWASQVPCVAGEGLGKALLRQTVDTGKSKVDQSIDKAAGQITGTGAGTAGTAATKATSVADKAGATAGKAGTKASTSAAATTGKAAEKPNTLTKTTQDAAKQYGEKYLNKGQQELDKLMTVPKKGK